MHAEPWVACLTFPGTSSQPLSAAHEADASDTNLCVIVQTDQAMLQLIYASAATVDFSSDDLQQLLRVARENNESLGISGMLLFHEGSFLQVLEGEEKDVVALYDKIAKDDRHTNARVLLKAEIDERSFGDWKMGFYDASGTTSHADSGFIDFFRSGGFDEPEADRAKKTLMQFRDGAWRQYVDT